MKRPDNIRLPNLPLPKKLLFSVLLISGITIFLGTWYQVVATVYLQDPADAQNFLFGAGLGYLAWTDTTSFYRLMAFHGLGIVLLLVASLSLFRMTSLRRRVKAAIVFVALACAAIDVAGWIYAPECSSSNMFLGIAGIIAALPLLFLAVVPLWQIWVYKRWSGEPKRVVFIGGGFAGLYAARGLNKVLGYNKNVEITVIDRNNYFLFPPLLPSAAAGTIETLQVSYPFRRIFETTNIQFRKVDVQSVDTNRNLITGIVEVNEDSTGMVMAREAQFPYDYLVLAPGSLTQTFNTPGAEEYAFFMRELNDAVLMRNHVIDCFERAAVVESAELRQEMLRFAIVGAGPTGIETATEIYDLIHEVLLKRYPEIDPSVPEVCVIQSGEHILPGWEKSVVSIAEKQLNKLRIKLILKARVTSVGPCSVTLGDGRTILARTIIWCAGVKPSALLSRTGLPTDKSGRVVVNETLQVPGFPNIFVLGDAAACLDHKSGKVLPPLGQVAFQQGSCTAKNLVRAITGAPLKPFRYFNFGSLVSVGEHFAAVDLLGIRLSGFIGWFVWRSLYLGKLVGTSNKIRVMLDWTLDLLIERSITQISDRAAQPMVVLDGPAKGPHDNKLDSNEMRVGA